MGWLKILVLTNKSELYARPASVFTQTSQCEEYPFGSCNRAECIDKIKIVIEGDYQKTR